MIRKTIMILIIVASSLSCESEELEKEEVHFYDFKFKIQLIDDALPGLTQEFYYDGSGIEDKEKIITYVKYCNESYEIFENPIVEKLYPSTEKLDTIYIEIVKCITPIASKNLNKDVEDLYPLADNEWAKCTIELEYCCYGDYYQVVTQKYEELFELILEK